MLNRAAAMFLVCASMAMLVSCANISTHFLYAALPTQNQINAYREDPNSGILDQLSISPITAGEGVRSVVIHPSNKYMYAANSFENDVSQYALSPSGNITEVNTPRAAAGTTPSLAVVDSAGQFLYVANTGSNNISSYSIDPSTGKLTAVTGSPFPIGAQALNMAVAPSGNFLYITIGENQQGTIGSVEIWNLSGGALTSLRTVPAGTTPSGLAIHPNGNYLYAANFGDNSISEYTINADGSLTTNGTVAAGPGILSSPVALLVNHAGTYLYVVNSGSSTVVGYSIDATNGSLALISSSYSVVTNAGPSFIVSDASGKYLYVGNNVSPSIQVFSVNTSTGVITAVTSYSLGGNAATSLALTP